MADKKTTTNTREKYQPDILYISGSPRSHTSEALVALIEKGARKAGARSQFFFLSKKRIAPCLGCGSCSKTGDCVQASRTARHKLLDDYLEFHALLERADALVIVAPIYFAGPSSQLKALFDRLQPYWAKRYVLGETPRPKRPAQLFVVGESGEAHGHAPLVGIARSALAVAGFNLEKVHSYVGFKAKEEIPILPPEDERESLSLGMIAQLRRAVTVQENFEQRAVNAGGAYARYLQKIDEMNLLQEELQQIEAEIKAIKAENTEGVENIEDYKAVSVDLAYEEMKRDLAGESVGESIEKPVGKDTDDADKREDDGEDDVATEGAAEAEDAATAAEVCTGEGDNAPHIDSEPIEITETTETT